MSVCALMSSLGVIADDMLSTLIGDNKVWNYHTDYYYKDKLRDCYDSYSLYCDGVKEIEGKNYSIVRYFPDTQILAYIREDEGKVYISSSSPIFRDRSYDLMIDYTIEDLSEFPVFDFNARKGDTFKGLICWHSGYTIEEIKVVNYETRLVGDREVSVMTVRPAMEEWTFGDETIVEGIGYLDDWFFIPDYRDFTTSLYREPLESRLVNLNDTEGNSIISTEEIFPPSPAKPENPALTIRKDRTWVYSFVKDGVETVRSLRFGDRIHNEYGFYSPLIDDDGNTVALMTYWWGGNSVVRRYAYDNRGISELVRNDSEFRFDREYGDFDIYRFENPTIGYDPVPLYSTICMADPEGGYRRVKVMLEKTDIIETAGIKRLRQTLTVSGRPNEKFIAVEGIGANTGWLYEPAWGNPKAYEANGLATLKEVLDGDGNVIFRYEDFGPTDAVEGIEDDCAPENDTRMFDLFGREIRDPQPGTIYVQGGRKFVAR